MDAAVNNHIVVIIR